ncbi:GntR family transcriptional regulator [Rhodococcus opacus]|nr:GntR family transcriptional regulator [Rhodococcus opacus]MDJ0417520.1 GntR family transcriptional regulator [Rhodococcus opacus]UNN01998.1 GntR family transcriptional regulator [Rhodococcus opacus]UZG58959.1 GntR family transcriptional regulator [Rhodococcus opacus]
MRETIVDGTFPPRSRLSEPEICSAVGVYRNTLRESFHLSICR